MEMPRKTKVCMSLNPPILLGKSPCDCWKNSPQTTRASNQLPVCLLSCFVTFKLTILFIFVGIQTSEDAKFYGISAKFENAFSNDGKDLVVQFTVKHEQNIDCGGGYLKVSINTLKIVGFLKWLSVETLYNML